MYASTARALAVAAATAADYDTGVRYYLRLLERDPYDEGAHLGLVACLVSARRHGDARRRYQAYSARMDELGVESAPFPGPVGS
jgi:DNA-binding SARP family transcriptional activator